MTPAALEQLIRETLQEIVKLPVAPVAPGNKVIATNPGSKLIFPITGASAQRVCEQEARFLFVHKLEQDTNAQCLYAVEAPTKQKYRFKDDKDDNDDNDGALNPKNKPKIDPTGQAGNIDVCLYDLNGKREHLIEFKALNPPQISYSKDFLKLICDEGGLTNYFVQVLEKSNPKIIQNVTGKYQTAIAHAQAQAKLHSLNQSKLVIFLCDMGKGVITKY
ncbi:MAG: hypothetical protein MdMp024_1775 [Bacteroidales bacterium]